MKQNLSLFLLFLCSISLLSSVISKSTLKSLFSTYSNLRKSETNQSNENFNNPLTLTRLGNLKVLDVGCNCSDCWVCDVEGKVYKQSATAPEMVIADEMKGKCTSIDVDSNKLPVIVDSNGCVQRLTMITNDSATWQEFCIKDLKIIDVAAGPNESIYAAVKDSPQLYKLELGYFAKQDNLDAIEPIARIDLGLGHGGDRIIATTVNKKVVYLTAGARHVPGIVAEDVSIDCDNANIVVHNSGIYYQGKCSQYFVKLNNILADRVSASKGNVIIKGKDGYVYNGVLAPFLKDC